LAFLGVLGVPGGGWVIGAALETHKIVLRIIKLQARLFAAKRRLPGPKIAVYSSTLYILGVERATLTT
jgi:hypothetical protein